MLDSNFAEYMSPVYFDRHSLRATFVRHGERIEGLKQELEQYLEDGESQWMMDMGGAGVVERIRDDLEAEQVEQSRNLEEIHHLVVNLKAGTPYDVYVGPGNRHLNFEESEWANPFTLEEDTIENRVLSIDRYVCYLLHDKPELLERVHLLRGKTLACCCSPKLCHADALVVLSRMSAHKLKAMQMSSRWNEAHRKEWESWLEYMKMKKDAQRPRLRSI